MTTDKHNKRPNVPPLRFPEFTEPWETAKLGAIAEFSKGTGISKEQRSETGLPCILYGELYTTYTNEVIEDVVSKTDLDPTDLVKSHKNDVIIPSSGETAEDIATARCVTSDNVLLGGDLNIIRLAEPIDGRFMSYQLNGIRKYDIAKIAQGVSVVHLYGGDLKMLSVTFPQSPEQKKIADCISLLDRRISVQSGLIEKLESLISGICKQFHDETENWIQVSFIELGEDYSGLTNKSAGDFGKGKPYITYLNVNTNHIIDESQIQYVSVADDEKQNKVHWGDVIFTLSSETPDEVAVGSVYLGNCDELYLNSFCFGIHIVNEQYIYQPYLSYFISSPQFRKWVFPLAQGSTRFNLQKADFMNKKFLLPPIKEQKKLYDSLSTISKRVVIESSILSKLQLLKLYLLQQMFI